MKAIAAVLLILAASACQTPENKAKLRLARSAFERAQLNQDEQSMAALQAAIDVIPDGKARDEFTSCQLILKSYAVDLEVNIAELKRNLSKLGSRHLTTQADYDKAKLEAETTHPLPDNKDLVECLGRRLPKLTR